MCRDLGKTAELQTHSEVYWNWPCFIQMGLDSWLDGQSERHTWTTDAVPYHNLRWPSTMMIWHHSKAVHFNIALGHNQINYSPNLKQNSHHGTSLELYNACLSVCEIPFPRNSVLPLYVFIPLKHLPSISANTDTQLPLVTESINKTSPFTFWPLYRSQWYTAGQRKEYTILFT